MAESYSEPDLPPVIFFAPRSFGSPPLLLAMVAGIMLDQRAGLPTDAAWKSLGREQPQLR